MSWVCDFLGGIFWELSRAQKTSVNYYIAHERLSLRTHTYCLLFRRNIIWVRAS